MSTGRDGGSKKTMWIVLAVVGGLFLLCGCCVGVPAAIYFANKGKVDAIIGGQFAVEHFMQDLSAGNTDAAYGLTSKAYQSRVNKAQFKALLDKYPGLRSSRHQMQAEQTSITETSATFIGSVTPSSGSSLSCTIKVVKEGNEWKIDDFTVK